MKYIIYLIMFLLGVIGFIVSQLALNNIKDEFRNKKYDIYFKGGFFNGPKYFTEKGRFYVRILYGILFISFLTIIIYTILIIN